MILPQTRLTRSRELTQAGPDGLLLPVGAFMPVMEEDARTVAPVTGLTRQRAGEGEDSGVVGGFPRSRLEASGGQVARAGHSVAVAVQDADHERRLAERIRGRCGGRRQQHESDTMGLSQPFG